MLQRFCQYITDNHLFLPTEKILLTVSGGIDSVVMSDLFCKAGYSFGIAHCNFKLRGQESEQDEAFVKNLAERYKVDFFRKEFNTAEFASEQGISIQMAARDLRYSWFNSLIKENGYTYFATAHHRNDVMESLLMNLVKGTGIHGLSGIRVKTGCAVRPLLGFSREDIRNYAQAHKLEWREDSSNQSVKYQRNLIRLEVIPLLKKINPSLESTFEETIEKINAAEVIYNSGIEEIKTKITVWKNKDLFISVSALNTYPQPSMVLYEIINDFSFNYSEVKNLFLTEQVGKKIESVSHIAIRDRNNFIISPRKDASEETWEITPQTTDIETSDERLKLRITVGENFEIPIDSEIACLDMEKLEFPLKIRKWKEGDWFIPLGLGKKKKLSDFLVDKKIPLSFKERVKVLISGDSIVWVVGLRTDDRFKITPETQKILIINKEKL